MTRTDQLRELEHMGFRASTIGTWSDERITTVLAARQRDNRLALARAANTAANIDGMSRGQPSRLERQIAAIWLEETLERGGDELVNAVLHCGAVLSDTEARTLAVGLIALFRGEYEQPAQHKVGAETTRWFDEGTDPDL